MKNLERIYNRLGETLQALSPYYREGMIKHMQENDAPANWFPLNLVRASEPDPFHLDQAQQITPYLALTRHRERFETLATDGCLEALGDDRYRLTDKGRRIVEGFFKMAQAELAGIDALPAGDMAHLADLLQRMVAGTVDSPEPHDKPSLMASRWTDPGPDAAPPVRVDQYVTDLLRYRDDAHIGAWRPTGVDGKSWETLTLLWRGEASSHAEISDRLSGRGYDSADFAEAITVLTRKGWIVADGDAYRTTQEGNQVRQKAEDETDRLFYIGWATLEPDELDALDELLARLTAALRASTEKQCWSQAGLLSQAIFPITRAVVNEQFANYFDSPRAYLPTLMAYGASPEALTVADYRLRFPYTKPERAQELLGLAEASGCLSRAGEAFALTAKGREAVIKVNDTFYRALAELDPLPEEESAELAGLLGRLVEATLAVDEPERKWALANIHHCHPEQEYGPLARIDQAIDDLNAFRDDVHIAAWATAGVSARDWDVLTLVWRDEADNADAVAEAFQYKGYTAAEYGQSLKALVDRGWLQETAGGYRASEQGRQIRQGAEEQTDRYFFGPWRALSDGQLLRLHTLLTQMKLALEGLAEVQADS